MVRTCKHHEQYQDGMVVCREQGTVEVQFCSTCKLFQLSVVKKDIKPVEVPPMPAPTEVCIHRGSQRRSSCCGGKPISRWICRVRINEDGHRMDCVETEVHWQAHRDMAPSTEAEHWEKLVAVCENCPLKAVIPVEKQS